MFSGIKLFEFASNPYARIPQEDVVGLLKSTASFLAVNFYQSSMLAVNFCQSSIALLRSSEIKSLT